MLVKIPFLSVPILLSLTLINLLKSNFKLVRHILMLLWWILHGNCQVLNLPEVWPFNMKVLTINILKKYLSLNYKKMEVCWLFGPLMQNTLLLSTWWKKFGVIKSLTLLLGSKKQLMGKLPKVMDFTSNMPKKHAWLELKENYKNLLKEVWQKTWFSVKEEVKVKNQLKFMNILKD